MTHEESILEAERILLAAGWRPHPDWGRFTRDTLVCGIQPDGSAIHVKDWARIPPGHPLYSADTPDEPHEAAAWLVARFAPPQAELTTEAALAPLVLELGGEEEAEDMPQSININVAPVFNVGGSHASSDAEGGSHEAHGEAGKEAATGAPVGYDSGREGDVRILGVPSATQGAEDSDTGPTGHQSDSDSGLTDVQLPESEASDGPAEAVADTLDGGDEAAPDERAGDVEDAAAGSAGGGLALRDEPGFEEPGDSDGAYAIDADYEEAGDDPELTDDAIERALLEEDLGAEILDEGQARERSQSEPYSGPTYIGLDDFDRLQRIKLGDVAAHAAALTLLVESEVSEQPGEYASVQGYVTSHLHPHTGAFWGEDVRQWERFLELEEARRRIAAIERVRKEKTGALLAMTTREQVQAFDVMADWP